MAKQLHEDISDNCPHGIVMTGECLGRCGYRSGGNQALESAAPAVILVGRVSADMAHNGQTASELEPE